MPDTPTTVVPFKLIKNPTPSETTERAAEGAGMTAEEFETLPEDRQAIIASLANIGNFLLENRMTIESVLCGISVRSDDPDADENERSFFLLTTPISNADFALSLKLMDSHLTGTLMRGNY